MFEILILFVLGVLAIPLLLVFTITKFAFKLVLVPVKILLLPLILVALIIKFVVVLTVGAVIFALLIPLAILVALCAAPFLIAAAVS